MNLKKVSKRILEGMVIGATLFGSLNDVYAPEIYKENRKNEIEYIGNYFVKKDKRDEELKKYAKFIGKPLIDNWIQDAIDNLKPHKLIDVNYVLGMMKQESRFHPNAVSWVGASGLMQVMKKTWEGVDKEHDYYKYRFDPDVNLENGIKVLDYMANFCEKNYPGWNELDREGKMKLVSAAYNGGNGHLMKKNWDIDKMREETRKYVPSVLEYYKKFSLKD